MDYKEIIYERRGPIAIIKFNRPQQMNAITPTMLSEVQDVLKSLKYDASCTLLILTGEGKAFMAGADLKALSQLSSDEAKIYNDQIFDTFNQIELMDIPTIAAINGYAFGGGMELALACSMRFAAASAKLALTEVKLGFMPGAGGTMRLPRLIPRSKALRILLTGETLTADVAEKMGVVDEVIEDGQLMDYCLDLAEKICSNAPLSVRALKACVTQGIEMPLQQGHAFVDLMLGKLSFTPDSSEGPKAFAEKRKPQFTGRFYSKEELK